MTRRKHVSDVIQAEVLVKSRRRCCVCFGLHRDERIKRGQIAHLDKDPANGSEGNLIWLCLTHHDQYDSKTRQSKNLTKAELARYRSELYRHYAPWNQDTRTDQLLNYLAASMDAEEIAKTLVKVGRQATFSPYFQIIVALTKKRVKLSDGDLIVPLLHVLDHLASWGFVTYEVEEPTGRSIHYKFRINHLYPGLMESVARAVSVLEEGEPWARSQSSN